MLQLKANYEQATATVEGLTKQLAFHTKRLADIDKLTSEQALPYSGHRTHRSSKRR